MSTLGKPERATQNRVIARLCATKQGMLHSLLNDRIRLE